MIIRLKEVEGKTWPEIRKIMEETTGAKLGGSTVQVRYARMKAKFSVFETDDVRCSIVYTLRVLDICY